jgi:RNA-directed DNA polymerase
MDDIRKVQHCFAVKAGAQPEHRFGHLYRYLWREEWLNVALEKVLKNPGARTPGVDGMTKEQLKTPQQKRKLVEALQAELSTGRYTPLPVRREHIPKPNRPSEYRMLGIPAIRDRVVQHEVKMLLEPIWESDFLYFSNGFRPGRRTMDCIALCYDRITTSNKYYWTIEGDIRKCFDRVQHNILLRLIERRVNDTRLIDLIAAMLESGVMERGLVTPTDVGTPQGGLVSPLLSNIYLHELDQWFWDKYMGLSKYAKSKRRKQGMGNHVMTRFADDFITLSNGPRREVERLCEELAEFLYDHLGLELNMEKTAVTHVTEGFDFLGFHVQYMTPSNNKPWLWVRPTKTNIERLKRKIKNMTKANTVWTPPDLMVTAINRVLKGWIHYYRYVSVKSTAGEIDWWVNDRLYRWLRKVTGKGKCYVYREYRRRQRTRTGQRWNLGVPGGKNGWVWLFKAFDVPLKRYLPGWKKPNPYQEAEETSDEEIPDCPFPDVWDATSINKENAKWHQVRQEILARDGYRCVKCGETTELEVHHRQRKASGGSMHPKNLITLCESCHKATWSYGKESRK